VLIGLVSYIAGWVARALAITQFFGWAAFIILGTGIVLAIGHTYSNSGLLISWLLLFWPIAGLVAFIVSRNTGAGRSVSMTEIIVSGGTWGAMSALAVGSFVFAIVRTIRWIQMGSVVK
jgi:hypothetical protein